MNIKTYFTERYNDEEMRIIYNEEYIPWNKTGILGDGELRDAINNAEKDYQAMALIAVENSFLKDCARRFANIDSK